MDEAGTVIFMPCVGEKKNHSMPSVLTIRDRVDSTSVLQEPFILNKSRDGVVGNKFQMAHTMVCQIVQS